MKALVLEKDAQQTGAKTQNTLRVKKTESNTKKVETKNAGKEKLRKQQQKKGKAAPPESCSLDQTTMEKIRIKQMEERIRDIDIRLVVLEEEYRKGVLMAKNCQERQEHEMRLALKKEIMAVGFIFNPQDEILVHHFLRRKCLDQYFSFSSIVQMDAYGKHPRCLLEIYQNHSHAGGKIAYFFTPGIPKCAQPSTDFQGHWIRGRETEIFSVGVKLGVKQKLDYCEGHCISRNHGGVFEGEKVDVKQELNCCAGDCKTKYTMIEYRLDPSTYNMKDCCRWFICKLYDVMELSGLNLNCSSNMNDKNEWMWILSDRKFQNWA